MLLASQTSAETQPSLLQVMNILRSRVYGYSFTRRGTKCKIPEDTINTSEMNVRQAILLASCTMQSPSEGVGRYRRVADCNVCAPSAQAAGHR